MKWFGEHKLFNSGDRDRARAYYHGIIHDRGWLRYRRKRRADSGRGCETMESGAGGIGNTLSGIINFRDTQKENES